MALLRQASPALLAALLAAGAAGGDDLGKLRAKLARETDPADRAKITVKIGEELLKQAAKRYKDGVYEQGESLLGEYRQAIHTAYDDLVKSGRDARRKPKGFKHLEIHLRQSRRRLDDIARAVPLDVRPPLEEIMADLETLRLKLLDDLMQENRKQGSSNPERKLP